MTSDRTWLIALAAITPGVVFAFPAGDLFITPADGARPGAGGLYGSGGAGDLGVRCSFCHTGGEGRIDVKVTASPAWLGDDGQRSYQPDARYEVRVELIGEHRGVERGGGQNGLAVAIEDATGKTAGAYITDTGVDSRQCPSSFPRGASGTTVAFGDCHAILSNSNGRGQPALTSWQFTWRAPPAGAGDLLLFYAVVDGTGGRRSTDDDVREGVLRLQEAR